MLHLSTWIISVNLPLFFGLDSASKHPVIFFHVEFHYDHRESFTSSMHVESTGRTHLKRARAQLQNRTGRARAAPCSESLGCATSAPLRAESEQESRCTLQETNAQRCLGEAAGATDALDAERGEFSAAVFSLYSSLELAL